MHTHYAKEQGLMVTSARLLCKMPLLSILLLAVIANGIGHSHRLTQEAVIMHKEICHQPQPSIPPAEDFCPMNNIKQHLDINSRQLDDI